MRFLKPKKTHAGKNTPISKLPVEVDCMCPDYRYRWAWTNHQRQAGPIGPKSLNQCINRAPRITNPHGAPGLCKHILATRDYIYGLLSGFPPGVGDTERLDALTKKATRRWLNFDQEMEKARVRDAKIAASKARRNVGLPPEQQNRPIAAIPAEEPPELPAKKPVVGAPAKPVKPSKRGTAIKPAKPTVKPSKPLPHGAYTMPEQLLRPRNSEVVSVDSTTNMKTFNLQESKVVLNAHKLIEELEDEIETGESPVGLDGGAGDFPPPEGGDMPIEPPVSDSAVGASTEDNVALSLLREIRDLLAELANEEAGEGGEAPELPPEGDEVEGGPGDDKGASEEEGEQFKPGKRPMPVSTGAE